MIGESRGGQVPHFFTEQAGRIEAEHITLLDAEVLTTLAPAKVWDEATIVSLDAAYEVAVLPILRGSGASSTEAAAIRDKRAEVFALLGVEGDGKALNDVVQRAKGKFRGQYPSPQGLIRNSRLLHTMGLPVVETIAKDADFVTGHIDVAQLDEVEQTLNQYDLSVFAMPTLALENPATIGRRLYRMNATLQTLQLPVAIAEIIRRRPDALHDSAQKQTLLASLAMRHGDLRSLIRSYERKEKLSPRERLAGHIVMASFLPIEAHVVSVIENEELNIKSARSFTRTRNARERRSYALDALHNENVIRSVGVRIVRAYLDQAPLSAEEEQQFPLLVPLAPKKASTVPRQSQEARLRNEQLTEADTDWIQELIGREVEIDELETVMAILNDSLIHGSPDVLRYQDETTMAFIREKRYTFFETLGWMTPGHAMYAPFTKYLQTNKGFMASPAHIIQASRLLAEPASGNLLRVFSVAHCRALKLGVGTWAQRLGDAEIRARAAGETVNETIAASPYRFVSNPLSRAKVGKTPSATDESDRIQLLASLLDEPTSAEALLGMIPELSGSADSVEEIIASIDEAPLHARISIHWIRARQRGL